jgi:hypothetical protein
MSMIGNYLRVTARQLDALREAPSDLLDVLCPEDEDRFPGGSAS